MGSGVAKPLLSIITAVLNRPEPLARTIESVLAQRCTNIEHIVVDGNSSDDTCAVLAGFEGYGVKWISEPDTGIYDALNKGIRLSRGSHIWVVHADDVLLPGAVETAMGHVTQDSESIWYADSRLGNRLERAPEKITPAIMLYNLGIAHQSIVAPRLTFDAELPYDPGFRIVSDYLWMREAHCRGFRFRKMPGCHVHLEETGLSSGQTKIARRLFRDEVAARTLLSYPFVPDMILGAMYEHRTSDKAVVIRSWVCEMESTRRSRGIDLWTEFREALEDYMEHISQVRGSR